MKQPRIISVGGYLVALLVAGCSGMGPNSTGNSLGVAAPQGATGVPSITAEASPTGCRAGLHIKPNVATIKVDQLLYLYDVYNTPSSYGCDRSRVYASWTTSGGVIRTRYGRGMGQRVVFSAVLPGVYHVQAEYGADRAHATVTVTLP